MLDHFLSVVYFDILELAAAIVGTIYLKRTKATGPIRAVVYFLWATFFIEVSANYTAIAYFTDYEYLSFLKDSPFRRNYWMYNIRSIFEFVIYSYYFKHLLETHSFRKTINILLVIFTVASLASFTVPEYFFGSYSPITYIVGSLVLFTAIGFFYLEMLKSDKILIFYKMLPFYLSVGLFVFFLFITPLFIYSTFFREQNVNYIRLNWIVLYASNTILYGMFILGFLKTSRNQLPQKTYVGKHTS